jgi:hypothetical protein
MLLRQMPSLVSSAGAAPDEEHGAELIELIASWPDLPLSIRTGIMALVRATKTPSAGENTGNSSN